MKEENTLTAKEWLESKNCKEITDKTIWINRMNEYSNYKSRALIERVGKFKQRLLELPNIYLDNEYDYYQILEEYNKHFNIK